MASGTIQKNDIITDEALQFGQEFANNVNIAIESVETLKKSAMGLFNIVKQLNTVSTQSGLDALVKQRITITNQATQAYQNQNKALDAIAVKWKEQDQLEKNLISTKKKNELATESTNRALIRERETLRQQNLEIKRNQTEMGRLINVRDKARTSIQNFQAKLALGKRLSDQEQIELRQSVVEFEKYDKAVNIIKKSTGQFQENVGNYPKQIQSVVAGIKQLIPVLGVVAGIRTAFSVISDSFGIIRDFDRQLIAVGKTTNITGPALTDLGRRVVQLGKDMDGVSVEGLLKSAEIAGQLGVKGADNILTFSTAIEKLKLTSDIVSDEQVQNFAQFIEVSQDSFENADRLASVMTVLGNNFATTESKVLGNATEIQKSVSIYNASAEGVLALGAATSALGNEAETSRTAIQKTFRVIDSAIASGTNLQQVLKLTGLTEKELAEQFNKDATGVFVKFIKGLSDAKNEGRNLNKILQGVDLTETRAVTVVGSLAANYDKLAESVTLATAEYQDNLALGVEVNAATQSLSSIVGDIKDRWAAYVLNTSDANSATSKIANVLKFVRDNLDTIINTFIKYGSVLLTYIGVMKTVNLITVGFTAIKKAAAAAELSFALATGIGRKAVLAQAAATKAAAVAQTGLNIAMRATPWGLILGLVAAAVVAYKAFNDELSESEKIQKRINDNIERQKKINEESAESSRQFTEKQLEQVTREFEARRAKEGDSKKLDQEEIEAKKKLLQSNIETNDLQIAANKKVLEEAKSASEEKIKILEEEVKKQQALVKQTAGTGGGGVNTSGIDRAQKQLADAKVEQTNQLNNLKLFNGQLFNENKELNDGLSELDRQQKNKNAEAQREEEEETKREREKRLKEAEAFNKLLLSDKYNLRAAQLKSNIDNEKRILDDERGHYAQRLLANQAYFDESVKLLELQKENAIANAKGREDEIKRLQLEFDNDRLELENQRGDNAEKILADAFERTKKRLETENNAREQAINDRIAAERQALILELEASGITGEAKLQRLEAFEKRATEIRREAILQRLDDQVKAIEAELSNPLLSPEQRIALEQLLAEAKMAYNDQVTDNALANIEKQAEAERKLFELKTSIIRNASQTIADSLGLDANNINALFDSFLNKAEATGDAVVDKYNEVQNTLAQIGAVGAVTGDILNSVFEANIDRIDEQIEASEEFYNRQFELAQGDVDQQNAIRAEQELKKQELEKKKRKEEEKAAKFAKGFSIFNIGITTAQAVIAALAPPPIGLGPLLGQPLAILAGALGALQVAAVLAKPIPKYEHGAGVNGRPVHPGGPAEVAEGNKAEIVHEPGKRPYVQHKHAVLNLSKGTTVYPNYDAVRRAAIMTSLQLQSHNINQYEALVFDNNYDEVVNELKRNTKAVQNLKLSTTVNQKNMDIDFELFKYKNLN